MPRITPRENEAAEAVAAPESETSPSHDALLRALADADNARKRAERRAMDAGRYAVSDFARAAVEIADNLRRAIASADERGEESSIVEGVRATERLLDNLLERFGVRRVDALGTPFDPTLHEAVLEVDDPALAPGSVSEVLEDGYTIHDRLLRPARVAVARTRPASPDQGGSP
jgi:molecular chaperone GrpE